jgi:hypothetical protein
LFVWGRARKRGREREREMGGEREGKREGGREGEREVPDFERFAIAPTRMFVCACVFVVFVCVCVADRVWRGPALLRG